MSEYSAHNNQLQTYINDYYKDAANGLRASLKHTKAFTDQIPRKLREMQARFLDRNSELLSDEQIELLKYYLNGFLYKEFLCDWLAEQIWGIVRTGTSDRPLVTVLHNSLDSQDTSDIDTVALSLSLDNYLVQAAAFLDFYLLYIGVYFRQQSGKGFVKWADIEKVLKLNHQPPFDKKAQEILTFFNERVFFDQIAYETFSIRGWGKIVNELRHKVVHRDREVPDFSEGTSLTEKMIEGWPEELRSLGCARFCADVRGDMFLMVSTLAGVLYDEVWRPGP